jgi:hypothetical protein
LVNRRATQTVNLRSTRMLNKVLRELNSCGARQYELADGF